MYIIANEIIPILIPRLIQLTGTLKSLTTCMIY